MAIPPRWLNCPRKSSVIADKFIAFKTFLDDRYNSKIPDENIFQFSMLNAYLKASKYELGLIIDLTNTDRFYDRKTIENEGIKYCKIQCRGHGGAPTSTQTNAFLKICSNFFDNNPGKLIGVHCTHGFNRTGFLISAYFVESEDWSVDAAVEVFSKCRPPGIYKQGYLKELWDRFGSGADDSPNAPALPDWCYEDEGGSDDDDDVGFRGDKRTNHDLDDARFMDGEGRFPKRRRKEHHVKDAKFVEGVQGVSAVHSPRCEELQDICQEMCNWNRDNFPGCQPVSLDRNNLRYLTEKPYKVSWKADGTRYMMMINGPRETYLFDRDNSVFCAPGLTFPQRKNLNDHITDTLLDGELVMDKEGDQFHPRFLIYDIIKFQGQDVGQTDLDRRFLCIDKEIIGPRNQLTQEGRLDKLREPFSIRKKDFYNLEHAQWVLEKLIPKITHETDGLVLQPWKDPYVFGQCPFVLKWKPSEMNSVDFQLQIKTVKQEGCLPERIGALCVQSLEVPFATIKVTPELRHFDKRIIECCWTGKEWKFMRLREDKSFPNTYNTALSVCESIKHPVTKEMLLDVIAKHRYRHEHHHNQGGHNG
ncbi:mRNA-capping enzyme-like [Rhopilema esculentum]|uniref:mRNA-capping enzyme-like n=1 Tax=Rhopilema esculentum TaxID=499914 RepID=UPI0031D889C0|eukprot:gene8575-14583_t